MMDSVGSVSAQSGSARDFSGQRRSFRRGSAGRIIKLLPCPVALALLAACAGGGAVRTAPDSSEAEIACADSSSPGALAFGLNLQSWAARIVTDTGSQAEQTRRDSHLSASTVERVYLVHDERICQAAAVTYSEGKSPCGGTLRDRRGGGW